MELSSANPTHIIRRWYQLIPHARNFTRMGRVLARYVVLWSTEHERTDSSEFLSSCQPSSELLWLSICYANSTSLCLIGARYRLKHVWSFLWLYCCLPLNVTFTSSICMCVYVCVSVCVAVVIYAFTVNVCFYRIIKRWRVARFFRFSLHIHSCILA